MARSSTGARRKTVRELVAFDLETTGLDPTRAEILEVAAIRFTPGVGESDRFHSLVRPQKGIPRAAQKVHGIRNRDVRHAPPIQEVLGRFLEWLGPSPVLVAHNAPFDTAFLANALARLGKPIHDWQVIDTLTWARRRIEGPSDYKLSTLLAHIGYTPSGRSHRATADAEGVVALVEHILAGYKSPTQALRRQMKPLQEAAHPPATRRQLAYLQRLGVPPEEMEHLTKWEASALIEKVKDKKAAEDRAIGPIGLLVLAAVVGILWHFCPL